MAGRKEKMNTLLAAIVFFTKLPLWKIREIPSGEFKHIVSRWSLCGWLTGGTMALTFLLFSHITTVSVAIVAAMAARLLLTGALHEDGLADFFDGFGGGHDRESTLRIMKDSHIGSFGVLGLILYHLLSYTLLVSLPDEHIAVLLLCADSFSKAVSSFIITVLPYARKEQESKAKVVYERLTPGEAAVSVFGGILPLLLLPWKGYIAGLILPELVFLLLYGMMKRRIQGYTGDCCGAMFLLTELGTRLGFVIAFKMLTV